MVTFVTLFLSLLTGTHAVQLAVDGPVAKVQILLDREVVTELTGPPWLARCDFGTALAPHELVAVALDGDGNELHRARQLVNLPRPQAETSVALVTGPNGLPAAVRVFCEAADTTEPLSVHAIFDGQVLQPAGEGLYPLPPHDPRDLHIVSAEARYLDGMTARSDVTFGGRYGSQIATELTAVPIVVDGRAPKPSELNGVFRVRGRAAVPAAVEKAGSRVYLVRDQAAVAELRHVQILQDRIDPSHRLSNKRLGSEPVDRQQDQLHFVVANPTWRAGRFLYPTSSGIAVGSRDVGWLLSHLTNRDSAIMGQRPTDAVAVAAVQAAAEGAPRAVVLVLSADPHDASRHRPEQVRRYLQSLRVPLFVWTTGEAPNPEWGTTSSIGGTRDLRRAERALFDQLARQWIVWLEGDHMVNEVELVRTTTRIRLAGS
jgi:hypothetical protein